MAAAQGSEAGKTNLADLYLRDNSFAAAPADACRAFADAADLAYRPAMLSFGLCLESGEGIEKDLAKAFAFIDLAARDDKKFPAADAERDKLAAQLSPEQKTAAAAFEADFKARRPNAAAG
jgi:TPR repeat protein